MYPTFKRFLDISVSLVLLALFLVPGLLAAVAILIESGPPIFFFQDRVGRDGRIFRMMKFRSMIRDAEKMTGPVWATKNDPRVTRVGRFLRRLRLDEIPQFVNVLEGKMSIIGPRPERPIFVEELQNHINGYNRRLRVRPGVTGLAQVILRYDTSIEDVAKKISYDLDYIDRMSFRLDLEILARTAWVMLSGKGAH